jgi:hypothetical protein
LQFLLVLGLDQKTTRVLSWIFSHFTMTFLISVHINSWKYVPIGKKLINYEQLKNI